MDCKKHVSSRRFWISSVSLVFCLLLVVPAGCTKDTIEAVNPIARGETLTQVSTINALLAGVYDGVISSGQLKDYGDFGIGTFEALDGEMVVLDGKIYQIKADGVAYPVADSLRVPFAAVTHFDIDYEEHLVPGINYAQLQDMLDKIIPSPNIFYAVKISGTFSYVKTRSVPEQSRPYPPLTEVTKNQPTFEFHNITGTIVGFRCPQYVNGVNVTGYHLHFLTDDRKAGGHLLELSTDKATAMLDNTPAFFMILPGENSDFYKLDLSGGQQSEVEKAEK